MVLDILQEVFWNAVIKSVPDSWESAGGAEGIDLLLSFYGETSPLSVKVTWGESRQTVIQIL